MASTFGTGFLRGLTGTGIQLFQLKQVADRERARQETEKAQLKLLQQRAKGDEARLALEEQSFKLKMFEIMQRLAQHQELQQEATFPEMPAAPAAPEAGALPEAPGPGGLTLPQPAAAPEAVVAPAQGALLQAELTRRQQQADALQARITRLLPRAITEEGKRLVSALQTEQGRALGEVHRLRGLLIPGASEVEQITGRPLATLRPEEIRGARKQAQQERLNISAAQGERAAQLQVQVARERLKAENEAKMAEILLPTAEERREYRETLASISHLENLLPKVTLPEIQQVLGPLFGENPQAALKRTLGERFEEGMTPSQREFLAEMGRTIAVVRKTFLGVAQTPQELQNARTYLPKPEDIPATVQAKLQAMRTVAARDLEAFRTTGRHLGIREPFEQPPPATGAGGQPSGVPQIPPGMQPGQTLPLPGGGTITRTK